MAALAYAESEVAALCDRRETAFPLADVRLPGIDETSRADGSRWGGALAYWEAEAVTAPSTLPRFRNIRFMAQKLIAIAYATGELMRDAPMFDAHIRRIFGLEIGWKLDLAVIAGTGAGVPLGILKSPALISVAKELGQGAATITPANIAAMWKRLPAPSRKRAVWLVHEDIEEQLDNLFGAAGGPPAGFFLPAGWNGNEYPVLKGRPVIAVEQCPAVGTVGDIILADLWHYIIVDGGINPSISADVRFLNDEIVWRFVLRVDGKSSVTTPITPYAGSATRSPFVTLATRA